MNFLPLSESFGFAAIIIFFAIIACKLVSCLNCKPCGTDDKNNNNDTNQKQSNDIIHMQRKLAYIGIIGLLFGSVIILADVIFLFNMSSYIITNNDVLKYFQNDICIMHNVGITLLATGIFILIIGTIILIWAYNKAIKKYFSLNKRIPQH